MSFNSQGIIFAKFGNSLLKSVNGGINFAQITSQQEYVIEYSIGSSDELIINLAENEIYYVKKSIDNGQTWADITGILSNQLVYDLQFDVNSNVLANSNLIPGTYKYEFDASDLTSGIYFYTLSVNEFSETRKMFLVK